MRFSSGSSGGGGKGVPKGDQVSTFFIADIGN